MDFQFSEIHEMIRETARKFAKERVAPGTIERDEREEFPKAIVKELAELGFMGMMVPEEWGGAGLDALSYALAVEEISKVDASVGVIMSVNNSLVCFGLNKEGSQLQKERFLRDLASGRKLGAFALSEPEAGSDASNQRTTAARDGDSYILNGVKNWITNGSTADIVLVMAATDKAKGAKGISTFILEKGTPGFTVGKKERKLGIRSSDTVSLSLTDCRIPAANRVGEEGGGFKFAMKTLEGGLRALVDRHPRFSNRLWVISSGGPSVLPEHDREGIGQLPLELFLVAVGVEFNERLSRLFSHLDLDSPGS